MRVVAGGVLALCFVLLTMLAAEAGQATKSVGGATLTASYDPATGEVEFSISGTGNTIEEVERKQTDGQWQNVTGFDCEYKDDEKHVWRSMDTSLGTDQGMRSSVQYKVRFKVGGVLYEAEATIQATGGVTLSTPVPV